MARELDAETVRRLREEPDFVIAPKLANSLKALMERYPDGPPDHVGARSLGLTEEELEVEYQLTLEAIRERIQP